MNMTNISDEVRKLSKDFKRFPEIPDKIVMWTVNCFQVNKDNKYVRSFKENREETLRFFVKRFADLCHILNENNESIMELLDFDPNDLQASRFESFLAVQHAVFFLSRIGFKDIKLLRSGKSPSADLIAKYNNILYSVEVVCSSEKVTRSSSGLLKYIEDQYLDKKVQLESTFKEYNCQRKLFVVMLWSRGAGDTQNKEYFENDLKEIYEKLEKPEITHLAIVTIWVDAFKNEHIDAIYPSLAT